MQAQYKEQVNNLLLKNIHPKIFDIVVPYIKEYDASIDYGVSWTQYENSNCSIISVSVGSKFFTPRMPEYIEFGYIQVDGYHSDGKIIMTIQFPEEKETAEFFLDGYSFEMFKYHTEVFLKSWSGFRIRQ